MKIVKLESKHSNIETNSLNGNLMIWAKDNTKHVGMYVASNIREASQIAQTLDHFIETGKKKKFTANREYLKEV